MFVGFLMIGLFIAALAGVVSVAAGYAAKIARQRAASIEQFGQNYGMQMVDRIHPHATRWKFTRDPINFSAADEYPAIQFLKAFRCTISNVLEGRDDRGQIMRTFDAQYTVSTGKSSTTYYFSIASVDTGQYLPELAIQKEGLWDKVKRMFGNDDIQTGNGDFDKRFRIQCQDEPFARSLIMSEMQDRISAQPYSGIYLTAGKAVVLKVSLAQPTELGSMLDQASFLAERAVRPEELSRVRYALEHSGPAVITGEEESLRDFDEL